MGSDLQGKHLEGSQSFTLISWCYIGTAWRRPADPQQPLQNSGSHM